MGHHPPFKDRFRHHRDPCCPDPLYLKLHFKKYHRFFLFSPMLLILFALLILSFNRGQLPESAMPLFWGFAALVLIKEIASVAVSRRIFRYILTPVEQLKQAVHQVAQGNYDVQVRCPAAPEIDELIEAFNRMSAGLLESEAVKLQYEENRRELLSNISHDLKTPITSVLGFADGILEGVADSGEKKDAYVRIIRQNAAYMNRLIDDLLLYSKLDLQKLPFDFIDIDFREYVLELFQEIRLETEEGGVAMELSDAVGEPAVLALDPRHFTRVVRNIVSNALIHGGSESPCIRFLLERQGASVSLSITDNGRGIDRDQLPHIFDRFYRTDASRSSAHGGSGLGLAIAREIVLAHGGSISAESAGPGTTIRIELTTDPEVAHEHRKNPADRG